MKMMQPEMDVDDFNQKVSPDDFESGEFGTLDLGDVGQEGDTINFMAQGVVTSDGLKINQVAIMGGGPNESSEPDAEESSPVKKKASSVVNKITKGEDDNEDM